MTRWWLSFANAALPQGSQSLGVAIVAGVDVVSAIKAAWALGINPGGEVMSVNVDHATAARLSFDLSVYFDRLIPPDEAKQLSDRIAKELDS